ncbi:hypothetical protein [Raoultella terrigena]|uniref:hypothetical protein n=1 Tax=Raoultella terrigena TaxID=577 RepID=UPI0013300DBA|nr:hypothetical protein [Raoultella terrigena]
MRPHAPAARPEKDSLYYLLPQPPSTILTSSISGDEKNTLRGLIHYPKINRKKIVDPLFQERVRIDTPLIQPSANVIFIKCYRMRKNSTPLKFARASPLLRKKKTTVRINKY